MISADVKSNIKQQEIRQNPLSVMKVICRQSLTHIFQKNEIGILT